MEKKDSGSIIIFPIILRNIKRGKGEGGGNLGVENQDLKKNKGGAS